MSDPASQSTAAASPWVSVAARLPVEGCLVLVTDGDTVTTFAYLERGRFYDPSYGWVLPTHWAEVTLPNGNGLPNLLEEDRAYPLS